MNVNVYTNVLILKLIKAFIKKYNNSNCIHNDLLLHPVFCGSKNVVLNQWRGIFFMSNKFVYWVILIFFAERFVNDLIHLFYENKTLNNIDMINI